MMGNFLTTLGNAPEDDRAMFEELGLNVTRQADNGARPRPDNRSGWLEGETPDVIAAALSDDRAPAKLEVRLWDPSTQLRFHRKRGVTQRPEAGEHAA
jgi:biotin synthase